jgi:hypothetical protein
MAALEESFLQLGFVVLLCEEHSAFSMIYYKAALNVCMRLEALVVQKDSDCTNKTVAEYYGIIE